MPFNEVMTFVDTEYQIFALFGQNELHQVDAGERSGDHARHLPGPHHQGACGLGDLGAVAGASSTRPANLPEHRRSIHRPASSR